MGVSQPTISRELQRNSGKEGYEYQQAQAQSEARRKEACQPTKMTPLMIGRIEEKLYEYWSPEQISGWLKDNNLGAISHETIYLHVWEDKQSGGDLYKHLRHQGKKYDKRRNGKSSRGQIKNRVGIADRPSVVDEKSRIGDWEIDTVIGKGHSGALVTIVERKTKFTVAAQVNSKSAADVTAATISLLKPFKDCVHTITADNGKEFTYHERISAQLSADVFFADPYSSWQRGLNENTNGLLRQYFPKSTDFKAVHQEEVNRVVSLLNCRPRKTLEYKSPLDLMAQYYANLAA